MEDEMLTGVYVFQFIMNYTGFEYNGIKASAGGFCACY